MRAAKFLIVLLFSGCQAVACPQGYESPESLVKRARVILELEVLSVTNAPPPVISIEDEPRERVNAQATVRVVRCLKGRCMSQTFALIGGPYDSCAPFFCYLKFKAGDHLALIVEHELPRSLKGVVVNWRGRVIDAREADIAGLMKSATVAWRKQLELFRSTAPEAFARAEAMLKSAVKKDPNALSAEGYPVLACLRILRSNPDDLPALPLVERRSASSTRDMEQAVLAPEADPLAGQMIDGVYHTVQYRDRIASPALEEAIKMRLEKHPSELVSFHRDLLAKVLNHELGVQRAKATEVINSLDATNAFCKTDFDPYKCRLSRGGAEKPELRSLQYALELADDEPDSLVWSTFGLGFSGAQRTTLDPTYIGAYVARNPKKDYRCWPRLLLLLSVPDKRASGVVEGYLNQEDNLYRMERYAAFFLALRRYPQVGRVLDRFEALAADEIRQSTTQERRQQVRESIQRGTKEIRSLFGVYDCRDAELLKHLDSLETQ